MQERGEEEMTTKRKIGIALLTMAAAGMLFGMAACSEAESLKQPQALHIENEILYWDEVENAEGYLVEVNGEEYEAEENEFSFIKIAVDPQEYTFRVQAYGDLYGDYGNSAWSEEVSYTPQIATGWSVRQTEDGSGTEVYVEDPAQVQGKVVIPATYGGVPVTNIAENAFKDCAELTSVVMSDNFFHGAYTSYGLGIIIPYREGYTFKGWATEENGEIVIGYELFTYKNMYGEVSLEYYGTLPLTTLLALEENIVFYAVWEKES